MFLRFETDVDMSQQKLDKLDQVRQDIAQTMQGALSQFEDAVRELDKVAPAKRIVQALETPTRRAVPTFGKKKAMEAAKRFDDGIERVANAALSTPVLATGATSQGAPTVLGATVSDAEGSTTEAAASEPTIVALTGTPTGHAQATTEHRQHDADDEFAALLMQP